MALQQVQHACSAETLPFLTSSVESPQQQHEHMGSGISGGQKARWMKRVKTRMHRTGMANKGLTNNRVKIAAKVAALMTFKQKKPR